MIRRTIKNIRFMIRWMTKIYVLWYFEWRKYRFYDALNEENIRFIMHWMRKLYVLWCVEWGKYMFYVEIYFMITGENRGGLELQQAQST